MSANLEIKRTPDQIEIVNRDRETHADEKVRRQMWALWLLHHGLERQKAADIIGISRATIQRYVAAFRDGGLEASRRVPTPQAPRPSALAGQETRILESLKANPVRSVAEAKRRIFELTGVSQSLTQTRRFLHKAGLKWLRTRAIPVPPKKKLEEHLAIQAEFLATELEPCLEQARAGQGHVFFVDAAHFVLGTFLGCIWAATRIFLRASSGRQRFNVLGAWNAITNTLMTVKNTTVVNTATMCELIETIAAQKLVGAVTLVLDNARYQRNKTVQALADKHKIRLLFLPPYSPNLNLIERLWRFIRKESLHARTFDSFDQFQATINQTIQGIPDKHKDALASLMTHTFQTFEDVPLLPA